MGTVFSALARILAMLAIAAFLVSSAGQQTTRLLFQNIVQHATDNFMPPQPPPATTLHTPSSTPPKEIR